MNFLSVLAFVVAVALLVTSPEMATAWGAIQEKGLYQYLFSLREVSTALMLSLILLFSGYFFALVKRVDANYISADIREIQNRLAVLEAPAPEDTEDAAEPDQDSQVQVAALLGEIAQLQGRVRALQVIGHGEMAKQLGEMLTTLRLAQNAVVPLAGQIQEMQTLCDAVGTLLDETQGALDEVAQADMKTLAKSISELQERVAFLVEDTNEQQALADKLLELKSTLAQIEVDSVLVGKDGAPLVDADGKPATLGALVVEVERLQAAIRAALEEADLDSLSQEQAAVGELIREVVTKIDQLSALANALRPAGTVAT